MDLRERIVGFVKMGGSKTEASRMFGVGRKTVYRYLEAQQSNTLAPKTSWGSCRKSDPQKILLEVRRHNDATLAQLGAVLGIHPTTVRYHLRKMGVVRKKNARVTPNATNCTGGSSKGSCAS